MTKKPNFVQDTIRAKLTQHQLAAKPTAFTDTAGRVWDLRISVSTCRFVQEKCGVDLAHIFDKKLQPFADLLSDPPKLCDVLFVICEPQATAAGVTDEQFGSALGGDSLEEAADALFEALCLFSPTSARAPLAKFKSKSQAASAELLTILDAKLEAADPVQIAAEIVRKAEAADAAETAKQTAEPMATENESKG